MVLLYECFVFDVFVLKLPVLKRLLISLGGKTVGFCSPPVSKDLVGRKVLRPRLEHQPVGRGPLKAPTKTCCIRRLEVD